MTLRDTARPKFQELAASQLQDAKTPVHVVASDACAHIVIDNVALAMRDCDDCQVSLAHRLSTATWSDSTHRSARRFKPSVYIPTLFLRERVARDRVGVPCACNGFSPGPHNMPWPFRHLALQAALSGGLKV